MVTRTKTRWTLDSQNQFARQIGWKLNSDGRYVQHKFRLGDELTEAQRREKRIKELWDHIESRSANARPLWDSLTLAIAKAFAGGKVQYRVSRLNNSPEAYARYISRLQREFPFVPFCADDEAAFETGMQTNTSFVKQHIDEWMAIHTRNGNVPVGQISNGPTLHQALCRYADSIRRTKVDVPFPRPFGLTQLRNVDRLKERHRDEPLIGIGFGKIQEMIDYWRSRPLVKTRGTPCKKSTVRHHVGELLRFFKWLHLSEEFAWRKPNDFADLQTKIDDLPHEVQAKATPLQVRTYTVDQLTVLYRYATPMERLLLLLGVNCGFGAAEIGTVVIPEIKLRQSHPFARQIDFVSTNADSFIKRIRLKKFVYGEHLLWPHTVAGIEWMLNRRKSRNNADDGRLMVSSDDLPYLRVTKSGHNGQWFANRWKALTTRVQRDYPEFPSLSFGKLRKTGTNLIRQAVRRTQVHAEAGEIAGVFACHGVPVKTDDLSDRYSNRLFGDVFRAIKQVELDLAPMFESVPQPFADYRQQYISRITTDQIHELKSAGQSVREIAVQLKISKSTVHRHLKQAEPTRTK